MKCDEPDEPGSKPSTSSSEKFKATSPSSTEALTSMVSTTHSTSEQTTFSPNYPLVHITGSISSTHQFHNFASLNDENYIIFKNKIESELEMILESSNLIVSAKVIVTNAVETDLNSRQRSNERVLVEFVAACTVRVPEIQDMDEIKSSITSSISNFDPKLYELIDEESTSSFEASFAKPTIIKIKSPSENEISNKIGKFLFKYHSYYHLFSHNGNQLYTTK